MLSRRFATCTDRDLWSPESGGVHPVVAGLAADMCPTDTPDRPEHRSGRGETAQPPSADAVGRGRRLVVILALTSCGWLLAVLALWASADPVT
jgi:hypothetical protein